MRKSKVTKVVSKTTKAKVAKVAKTPAKTTKTTTAKPVVASVESLPKVTGTIGRQLVLLAVREAKGRVLAKKQLLRDCKTDASLGYFGGAVSPPSKIEPACVVEGTKASYCFGPLTKAGTAEVDTLAKTEQGKKLLAVVRESDYTKGRKLLLAILAAN